MVQKIFAISHYYRLQSDASSQDNGRYDVSKLVIMQQFEPMTISVKAEIEQEKTDVISNDFSRLTAESPFSITAIHKPITLQVSTLKRLRCCQSLK